jgi:hypothetical protein
MARSGWPRHACPLLPWVPSGRLGAEVDRRPKGAEGAMGWMGAGDVPCVTAEVTR